jgi:hypothetical protein
MGAVENVKEIADLIGKFHDIELNRSIQRESGGENRFSRVNKSGW